MARRNRRGLAVGPAIVVTGAALAFPAGAQFLNDRSAFDERLRPQQVQLHEFFPFPFWGGDRGGNYNPYYGPPVRPYIDYSKAPPPRKPETPPSSTVLVIGDSLADWLGYGLEEALADTPEIGVVRKIKGNAGLIRYEARNDTLEWSQAAKDLLANEKPNAIVVMLGLNDRQSLRERAPARPSAQGKGEQPAQGHDETPAAASGPAEATPETPPPAAETSRRSQGGSYEFHTDKWAELYSKRIDDMIAVLKTKGVPVLWVGLPAIRGPRSTSDMSYLDELFRARAEKAGITYVDVWDGFVDERGTYAVQGPDFEGQIRRLRSGDGIHFTKAGAVKLGYYVEHDLRRVMSSHVIPVALPGPEQQSPAKGAGPRPAIGPIIPLGAIGEGDAADLLGAGGRPAEATSDPIAKRVLSRGDPIAAQSGRADDFTWPRADTGTSSTGGSADAELPPVAPPPQAKGAPGKPEAKKPNEAKANDAKSGEAKTGETKTNDKTQAGPDTTTARQRRPPRADLDGAPPRPPLPVGPAAAATTGR